MDKVEFSVELTKLMHSKQVPVDRMTIETYWEDLSGLDHLLDTLKYCRDKTWYRDISNTSTRFPETAEIKRVNMIVCTKKRMESLECKQLPEPKSSKWIPKGSGMSKSLFCADCMRFLNMNCYSVWEYLRKNNIKIPLDYKTPKGVNFKEYAEELLGGGMSDIEKNKVKNIFTKMGV